MHHAIEFDGTLVWEGRGTLAFMCTGPDGCDDLIALAILTLLALIAGLMMAIWLVWRFVKRRRRRASGFEVAAGETDDTGGGKDGADHDEPDHRPPLEVFGGDEREDRER